MAANPPGPVVAPKPRARWRWPWRWRGRGWKFYVLVGLGIPFLILSVVFGYFYVSFSRMIDARLHGEMQRADPRVYARPFQLRRAQSLTPTQIIDRLNSALQEAVKDPDFKANLAKLGAEPVAPSRATPEGLHKRLKAEIDQWGPIIKKAGQYAD